MLVSHAPARFPGLRGIVVAERRAVRLTGVSGGDGSRYIHGMSAMLTMTAGVRTGTLAGCRQAVFGLGARDAAGTGRNGGIDEGRTNQVLTATGVGVHSPCGGNVGPAVPAGTDRGGAGAPIGLGGTARDDGQPTTRSLAWSNVSGPGAAVFVDANAVAISVACDATGPYVLRRRADDGAIAICAPSAATVSAGSHRAPLITHQAPSAYGTPARPWAIHCLTRPTRSLIHLRASFRKVCHVTPSDDQ